MQVSARAGAVMANMLSAAVVSAAWLAAAPALAEGSSPGAGPVPLASHRAVYELSLLRGGGSRGVEGASGRIALEFSGDACEGYALKFRQVVNLTSGETGTRTIDSRSDTFESTAGDRFRFRVVIEAEGAADSIVDGTATRPEGEPVSVRLAEPAPASFALPDRPLFPTAHSARLIQAARAGERTLTAPVYDAAGDGRKVYDTLAVIGAPIEPSDARPVEPALRASATAGLRRWPVRLSYFAPGEGDRMPAYVMAFELYDDGVSRALQIDYGDFALGGELTGFETLPGGRCGR